MKDLMFRIFLFFVNYKTFRFVEFKMQQIHYLSGYYAQYDPYYVNSRLSIFVQKQNEGQTKRIFTMKTFV